MSRDLAVRVGIDFVARVGGVRAERRPLAVAVLAHRQQLAFRVGDDHADDLVAVDQVDALDALGVAAHRPGVGFGEANRHALARAEHDFVAGPDQGHVDQRVAFFQVDADHAALPRPAVFRQLRLLDQTVLRGHEQVRVLFEVANRDHALDFLLGLERQHVGDRPPAAGPRRFGNVVDLEPVTLPAVGEAEQVGVRRCDEEVLDEVFFAGPALDALAAAMLRAEGAQRHALDVATVADADDDVFFGNQVFQVDIAAFIR